MFDSFKDITLFKKTNELNGYVTEFFDNLSKAGLLFEEVMEKYKGAKKKEILFELLEKTRKLERRNDQLRRSIEASIYRYTLLPEARSDVLRLLEKSDKIINQYEKILDSMAIELPDFTPFKKEEFSELVEKSVKAVESLVLSARSFFVNPYQVENFIHKVSYFEKAVDELAFKMKQALFEKKTLELSQKRQLKDFVEQIESLSDFSEDVSDSLVIFAMKRII
ncbi:MAG: DUF47 family protein [Alphaproteobacteria bacterium]|nr:DUF47 family protein [Alphaproteobacteria bacterium]